MLVFTRYENEAFYIGDDIKITVLRLVKNQVRIGIAAPKDVPVHREEIYRQISGDGPNQPGSDIKKPAPEFHVDKNQIVHELDGYSLEFNLPDGTPVRLSHTDHEILLKVAKELYQGKLGDIDGSSNEGEGA